jgi:acetolactate synthase-1/3 small subunit
MRHAISVLVENEFGVLARIANLFSGRGYNIDSLTVSETLDPTVSRMTIVTRGNERIIEQILKQLNRLINVIKVDDLTQKPFVERELSLIKVKRDEATHRDILKVVELFGGRIVGDEESTYMIEFTGDETALKKILDALKPYGILEFVSSGSIAIEQGASFLKE